MAKLSQKNQDLLMIEMNRVVDSTAEKICKDIREGRYGRFYPPNNSFSRAEVGVLDALVSSEVELEVMRKIIADCSAHVLFEFFNLIDWTSEPVTGAWENDGVVMVDRVFFEDEGMMMNHDAFLDKYWDWVKIRKLKSVRLDDFNG